MNQNQKDYKIIRELLKILKKQDIKLAFKYTEIEALELVLIQDSLTESLDRNLKQNKNNNTLTRSKKDIYFLLNIIRELREFEKKEFFDDKKEGGYSLQDYNQERDDCRSLYDQLIIIIKKLNDNTEVAKCREYGMFLNLIYFKFGYILNYISTTNMDSYFKNDRIFKTLIDCYSKDFYKYGKGSQKTFKEIITDIQSEFIDTLHDIYIEPRSRLRSNAVSSKNRRTYLDTISPPVDRGKKPGNPPPVNRETKPKNSTASKECRNCKSDYVDMSLHQIKDDPKKESDNNKESYIKMSGIEFEDDPENHKKTSFNNELYGVLSTNTEKESDNNKESYEDMSFHQFDTKKDGVLDDNKNILDNNINTAQPHNASNNKGRANNTLSSNIGKKVGDKITYL